MNGKITQTEFKKWSQQLEQIYEELLKNSNFTEKDKQEITNIGVIGSFYTGKGVISATLFTMIFLETILDDNVPLQALEGLTFRAWEEKVFNRLKEHCIAGGYYNPASPPDLTLLRKRRSKVNKIFSNQEKRKELLSYADPEEYEIISNTAAFKDKTEEIFPKSTKEDKEEIPRGLDFIIEDWVGRGEKLIRKQEQAEKANNSSTSNPPRSHKPAPEYENNLEVEIKNLQEQIKELDNKINNSDNSTQKETYQKMLGGIKKNLDDKQKEKDKLIEQKQQKSTANDNSNKLKWAIGLGIGVIVIGLVCLILIVNRRKES